MEEKSGDLWTSVVADGNLIATAIHDGHEVRPGVAQLLALPEPDRLREEDPYTGSWTVVAGTRIVGRRSRFEVDLNRPREKAVYRTPADAWGLRVWRSDPGENLISASLAEYDAFYSYVRGVLTGVRKRHGIFVVFDLHSYNHRRDGPDASPADPAANPEVNIGTASMDRDRWRQWWTGLSPISGRSITAGAIWTSGKTSNFGADISLDGSTSNFRTLVAPLPSSSRSSSWTNGPARSFPPTIRRSWRLCDRPSPV